VSREHATWVVAVAVLLTAGLFIGQRFLPPALSADVASFRRWFWESRGLDLVVQAGLIFAGALGIAALLPRSKEEDA